MDILKSHISVSGARQVYFGSVQANKLLIWDTIEKRSKNHPKLWRSDRSSDRWLAPLIVVHAVTKQTCFNKALKILLRFVTAEAKAEKYETGRVHATHAFFFKIEIWKKGKLVKPAWPRNLSTQRKRENDHHSLKLWHWPCGVVVVVGCLS